LLEHSEEEALDRATLVGLIQVFESFVDWTRRFDENLRDPDGTYDSRAGIAYRVSSRFAAHLLGYSRAIGQVYALAEASTVAERIERENRYNVLAVADSDLLRDPVAALDDPTIAVTYLARCWTGSNALPFASHASRYLIEYTGALLSVSIPRGGLEQPLTGLAKQLEASVKARIGSPLPNSINPFNDPDGSQLPHLDIPSILPANPASEPTYQLPTIRADLVSNVLSESSRTPEPDYPSSTPNTQPDRSQWQAVAEVKWRRIGKRDVYAVRCGSCHNEYALHGSVLEQYRLSIGPAGKLNRAGTSMMTLGLARGPHLELSQNAAAVRCPRCGSAAPEVSVARR
jgi:hypothetical protein